MTHRSDRVRSRLQRTDVHVSGSSVKTAGQEDDAHRFPIATTERSKNCPDACVRQSHSVRFACGCPDDWTVAKATVRPALRGGVNAIDLRV